MVLITIIGATLLVSLVSLVGVFALALKPDVLKKLLVLFVGFAAGGLIGGAFLHLLPEALTQSDSSAVFICLLIGFTFFFLLERYLHWRHCHEGSCDVHAFTYLSLWGDAAHNFIDGLLLAASFLIDFKIGMVTTLAIILHEIPQEIGDFGILVYGGFSRRKALLANFLISLTAIIGALCGYFLNNYLDNFTQFLLPFTAGGFIYVASSDLIPELHKQKDQLRANLAIVLFVAGLAFMYLLKFIVE